VQPGAPVISPDTARSRALPAALALLALVTVADLVVGSGVVLVPLLVVGPLVAASSATAVETAAVAVLATVIAVALAATDGVLGEGAGLSAIGAVAAGGVIAVGLARARHVLAGTAQERGRLLTAERTARRRSDLLARSGELLGSGLDAEELLREITGLPVPELADLAIIDLLQPDGTLRGAVTNATEPGLSAALRDLRERFPLDPASAHPVALALRTGEPQLLSEMTEEELRRYASSDEHFALIRRARYRSAIVLPLTARGRTAGALSFLRLRDATPFDADDLALGLDIARRAALALDNARLFGELRGAERRLEAIVANLGEAVTAFAPDGTIVFANQAAAAFAGMDSVAQLMATDLPTLLGGWIVLDEHGEEVMRDALPVARALAGEEPEPMVLRIVERTTGRDLWLLNRAASVRAADGTLQFVVSVSEDVGAVKRQERRERLLSNASKLLGSSLDVDATLDKAAWAVVPELADWARVDLPDERGVLHQVAVAHRDLELVDLLDEWRRDYPPDPADDRGPAEVLRTGRSIVWSSVDPEDVTRYAQSPRHEELMRLIDVRSMLIVPMAVGDRVIGTMQLATTSESERRLGAEQLEIAEELARRAAIAVENARVHADRTHIAATLQRSLLPPRLPVIPGLTIAARFRAAGAATEVGGDFYDLFQTPDRWMIMIGDVTGKGPGAAAVTSLARYTMRTVAQYERDPTEMLRRLNATLGDDPERRQICTAVCVAVQPSPSGEGVGLDIVCAGHPLPLLLRADGAVGPVGRPGTLLGAFGEGRWTATSLELGPGDALVLYTDGVTDTRGPEGRFGSARLEALLRGIGPCDADTTAERIDDALRAFGEQRDDVALLVLRGGSAAEDASEASITAAPGVPASQA
jgi:PAS domain S-box-containing protein